MSRAPQRVTTAASRSSRRSVKPAAPAKIQTYTMGMTDQIRSTQEYSRVMSESTQTTTQLAARTQSDAINGSMGEV